jgi:hypothetical protein
MSSGKEIFKSALQGLLTLKNSSLPDNWVARRLLLDDFSTDSAWTLLNELIQNAVDAGASNIAIYVDQESIIMEHNGNKKLIQKAIEGLCGFNISTKKLDSVGFMGLGFKSFVHYFSKVTIANNDIRFSTECPISGTNWKEIEKLYEPYWIDDEIPLLEGMTTYFRFDYPHDDAMGKMEKALLDFDTKKLAILAKRKLKELRLQDFEYVAKSNDDIVTITCEQKDLERDYLVLEEEITFSTEVTQQLAEHRKNRSFYNNGDVTTRNIRLIKEVEITTNPEGVKLLKSKSVRVGEMYCLVPLNKSFPFHFTIDCEWLMTSNRSELIDTYPDWHKEALEKLPVLIRRFLEYLNPSNPERTRVHRTNNERAKWLDIFSKQKVLDSEPALEYLNTTAFDDILRAELDKIEFIKCRDGEFRSPNNLRYLPTPPSYSSLRKLKDGDFDSFATDCFDCNFLDQSSMKVESIDYLIWCEIIGHPSSGEIKSEEIKRLWNKKSSVKYQDILDVLTIITPSGEEGPEVAPLTNNNWANLCSPRIVFDYLPNRGGERALYESIINNHPMLSTAQEIINELKEESDHTKYPGDVWRNGIPALDIDVVNIVFNDGPYRNKEYIMARFEYCMRSNQPDLVSQLLTKRDTIATISEIFIGPPLVTNSLVGRIAGDKLQTNKVNELMKKLRKPTDYTRKFLIDAGANSIEPKDHTTFTNDHSDVSHFLGINEIPPPANQGRYRATGAGPGKANKGAHWRKIDVIWPFPIEEHSNTDELGDFLCNPSDELLSEYNQRSRRNNGRRIEWYYGGKDKVEPGRKPAKWIVDLQNNEWVKCSDGGIRKPGDSPPEEGDGDFHALIRENAREIYEKLGIKFGQDTDAMDDEQVLEWWKQHPVRDVSRLINILEERGLEDGALRADIQDLQFISSNRAKAPFRRFIINISDPLGGYFGEWEELPDELTKFLKGKIDPPLLNAEMLVQFIESLTHHSPTYVDENITHLQNAHAQLSELKGKPSKLKLLTYSDEWVSVEDTPYIQLTADQDRSELFAEQVARTDQFPSDIDLLMLLIDAHNLELLDNKLTILNPNFVVEAQALYIFRIILSLGLKDTVISNWSNDEEIKVMFGDDEISLSYLIQEDEGKYKLYLSSDYSEWSDYVCKFLLSLTEHELKRRGKEQLRRALRNCGQARFEEIYAKLCRDAELKYFGFGGVEADYRLTIDEALDGGPIDDTDQDKPLGRAQIKDHRTRSPKEKDTSINPIKKSSSKSKSKSKKSGEAKPIPEINQRDVVASKKIGDKAEYLVQQELEKISEESGDKYPFNEQWAVINTNEKFGKNFAGYDLIATQEKPKKKKLRIEVKGKKKKWDYVTLTPQEMMWAFRTIIEPEEDGYELEYWICVVEQVFDDSPTYWPINWTTMASDTEISFKGTQWTQ